MSKFVFSPDQAFAFEADSTDELREFRDLFHIPVRDGKPLLYFTGNSLGLQPKSTRQYLEVELKDWEELAVEGHFEGRNPWFHYHKFTKKYLAELTGARESEVVSMNNLSSNLHLMLSSFYQPDGNRNKILIEAGAFPSDQYALETHVRLRGLDPEKVIVEINPAEGEHCLKTENIISEIEKQNENLALVMLSGIQYYTGQFFEIGKITEAAHKVGSKAGFDLAHAIGNVPLNLHNDNVDFAVWCSYKYLNSGPGGVSGIFVNDKFGNDDTVPRLAGWWGQREDIRFKMEKGFKPMPGADGWQLSNVNVLSTAAHWASLDIFSKAGMNRIRGKSLKLTGYLEYLLKEMVPQIHYTIITPSNPEERGAQLSLLWDASGKKVFEALGKEGIIVDWREPNVIRISPAPLYNTFSEIFTTVNTMKNILKENG